MSHIRIFFFIFSVVLFFDCGALSAQQTESSAVASFLGKLKKQFEILGWKDIENVDHIAWETHRMTVGKSPLIFASWGTGEGNTTLILSLVHGDEITPLYVSFRLAALIDAHPEYYEGGKIVLAPIVNPDGFFADSKTRYNARGVDCNRNFPTRDWRRDALRLWQKGMKTDPKSYTRRYPGSSPSSEQETLFQMALINRFKPSKIISIHAPLGFFDYDGPGDADEAVKKQLSGLTNSVTTKGMKLIEVMRKNSGDYKFIGFGVFPGSLGNFAGKERKIPTVTLELPSIEASRGQEYWLQFCKSLIEAAKYKIE